MDPKIIESIITPEFLSTFSRYYTLRTGKKIEDLDSLVEALSNPSFTAEDLFYERMDDIKMTEEMEDFFISNMEKFDYFCYFPNEKGDVGDNGSWIKIPNKDKTGYEIRFAKKSKRIHRWNEKISKLLNKSNRAIKKVDITLEHLENVDHFDEIYEFQIREKIGLTPYEVWYQKTKTTKKYLFPNEYEVVEDINEYLQYAEQKVPHFEIKLIYTSLNQDKIHYIMSRGIPRSLATIMASLEHCYFKFDLKSALELYNENFSKTVKIKHGKTK